MRKRARGRRHHVVARHAALAQRDVVGDRGPQHHRLLRDHSHLLAQASHIARADVGAVEPDPSGIGIGNAREQREQRGLSAPVGANDRDALPGTDIEREPRHGRMLRARVREGDRVERDGRPDARDVGAAARLCALLEVEFEELHQSLAWRLRGLDVVDHRRYRLERSGRHGKRPEREHEVIEGELAVDDLARGEQRKAHHHHERQQLDERRRERPRHAHAKFLANHRGVRPVEAVQHHALCRRRLHRAQSLQRLCGDTE